MDTAGFRSLAAVHAQAHFADKCSGINAHGITQNACHQLRGQQRGGREGHPRDVSNGPRFVCPCGGRGALQRTGVAGRAIPDGCSGGRDGLPAHGICNPAKYTLEQSLDLVKRAHKLDPSTELKLAKLLAPLSFSTEEESRFATRILEILERSPDPSTALPALRQLAQCPNAHVRSKAALIIGRINRNPQWAEQSAQESDLRVAANAVESLWGLDTPAAREAFLHAAHHEHHRIAANGIIGLYMAGHPSSIPLLFRLGGSQKPLARAAAAWTMGHLGDPRFVPRLAG